MAMVMEMMAFIRAVRNGDWDLHLEALQSFVKYFFASDKLNYARIIPVYLAEMKIGKETDPEIYKEFQNGNWVVNKNECFLLHVSLKSPLGTWNKRMYVCMYVYVCKVASCAIGADHALEHINRSVKVSHVLIGITLNPTACTKYFLIAPEFPKQDWQNKPS